MFSSKLYRAVRPLCTSLSSRPLTSKPVQVKEAFSTIKMSTFPTPSSDPPKKEMKYFPDMTTALPSESGEFRRVLWTGLYSQLVLMTVPVDGDIGEEVEFYQIHEAVSLQSLRFIPSIKSLPSHRARVSRRLPARSKKSRPAIW